MSWLAGTRARLTLLFARRTAASRIDEEVGFHIDMETARLVREEGLAPDEARRRALAAFGGVTRHKEALREGHGFAWLGGVSLDLRLGFRMLVKYPGLTVIGGIAMAFAVWVGVVTFEFVRLAIAPSLPLPGGDRIVQLRNWNVETSEVEPRALGDFLRWREALSSVTDLGAWKDETRNLIGPDGDPRQVSIAAMTASGFRIASGTPLFGRVLTATDELPGAPPVIVMGYDVWRRRFGADSGIIGRSLKLDDGFATVVGVMRPGFAFPVAHELWMPFRPEESGDVPLSGPAIGIFARLAPGATLADARAELALIGKRAATDFPSTHAHLLPQVSRYAEMFWEPSASERGLLLSFNLFAMLLLGLLCSTVALLLFARAATRESELVVRSALGASRHRIVAQLVAEALVLGGVAAVVGLAAAGLVLERWGASYLEVNLGTIPFWYHPTLSLASVVYAAALTVLGAVIAGAVPALKVTRGLATRLKEGAAGGGGLRFGGVWTGVIIAQVAVTVAFPAIVYFEQRELRRIESIDPGFRDEEYLGVKLELDPSATANDDTASQRSRFGAALDALHLRLAADPGVIKAAFVDRLPNMYHVERFLELDGDSTTREVASAWIDPSYFQALDAPIIAGRAFRPGEGGPDGSVVIVDQGFVDQVLLGRSAIGRRIRLAATRRQDGTLDDGPRPWHEIVGVVPNLGMTYVTHRGNGAGVYFPLDLVRTRGSLNLVLHARGDPLAMGPRVRALAGAIDPQLRLSDFQRLDRVSDGLIWYVKVWLRITAFLTGIALLLSLAGIYAVLSFTVARRTREIGVRVALGASRARVVAAIFRRPLAQVGLGVVSGALLVGGIAFTLTGGGLSLGQLALLVVYAGFMMGVCVLACIIPTRRALGVEPTEALRAD